MDPLTRRETWADVARQCGHVDRGPGGQTLMHELQRKIDDRGRKSSSRTSPQSLCCSQLEGFPLICQHRVECESSDCNAESFDALML
eukprot:492535-Hanusia_phi.AAC.1